MQKKKKTKNKKKEQNKTKKAKKPMAGPIRSFMFGRIKHCEASVSFWDVMLYIQQDHRLSE